MTARLALIGPARPIRIGDDRGEAGVTVVWIAVLIGIGLTLMGTQMWRAIEAASVSQAAAREAVRAAVESPSDQAASAAAGAANEELARRGLTGAVTISGAGGSRCQRVEAQVTIEVDSLRLPLVGAFGQVTVSGRHAELVDPLRSGVEGEATCLSG